MANWSADRGQARRYWLNDSRAAVTRSLRRGAGCAPVATLRAIWRDTPSRFGTDRVQCGLLPRGIAAARAPTHC